METCSPALPIIVVNILSKNLEFPESLGFLMFDQFILHPFQKSLVELTFQGAITPIKLGRVSMEFNDVFVDLVGFLYNYGFNLSLSIDNQILRSKDGTEFLLEFSKAKTLCT